jgi:hypothetical protein
MRAIQAFYILLICIVTLIGVAFLRMSYGDNLETGRAVYQHHIAPSEATRQKLAEVHAANNRALILPGCILGVFFVGSIFIVVRTTGRLRTPSI